MSSPSQPSLIEYNKPLVARILQHVEENKKTGRKNVLYSMTTCKRLDLMQKTLNSFINCCTDILTIDQWICYDDNSSDEDRKKMKELYPFIDFVFKTPEQKGHSISMNMIVDALPKETKYLVHFEDDWQFVEKKEYIKPAIEILNENKDNNNKIGQVLFNKNYAEVPFTQMDLAGGILATTKSGILEDE